MPGLEDVPSNILVHILLGCTPTINLLRHVSRLARVCRGWRQIVLAHPDGRAAYGVGAWSAQERARVLREVFAALQNLRATAPPPRGLPAPSPDIKKLSLYNRSIGDGGGRALGAALRSLPRADDPWVRSLLRKDSLSTHPIYVGTDGRGIPLVGVFLSNCDLTPAGLAPIAAGLARCDTRRLKTLRVNGNLELGDAGVAALAAVLPSSLADLYVGSTGCGDAGLTAVAAALPATQIQTLDAYDTPAVGEAGWRALADALPSLPQLRVLGLSGCGG